jgi:hypothetical protein
METATVKAIKRTRLARAVETAFQMRMEMAFVMMSTIV